MTTTTLIMTLTKLKGWGPKKICDYVSSNQFNYDKCVASLVNILNKEEKELFKLELVNSKITIQKNLELGIKCCCILDKEFPKKLYNTTDKCVFLFYKGNIELLSMKSLSIIGTRNPDQEFIEKGKKITSHFAKKGFVIVSGLALGSDTIAHQSTLDVHGKTIAVLPSSCDNIQPTSNKKLADDIVKNGGLLITEYSSGTPFAKFNYAARDRIQSLLSSTIIIIQASDNSGTMIATKKNIKDGKIVYAIKGNNLSLVTRYVDVDSDEDLQDIENWIL